jgi:proteasome lid subunit RPN8/RPN11
LALADNPLILPAARRQEMLAHVQRCLPEEACGLLGGRDGRCQVVLPVTNRLHSPVRYQMDPKEQVQALFWLDEHNLDLLAIFHSHPTGPDQPSPTDLAEFAYPGTLTVICWPDRSSGWQVSAFAIARDRVAVVSILTGESNPASPEGL